MKQKQQRIIILVIIVAILIGVSLYIAYITSTRSQEPEDSSADVITPATITPQEIIVSNLSSNSATISWYTDESARGYIKYFVSGSTQKIIKRDKRDSNTSTTRNLHYVQITGLQPNTEYGFEIYLNDAIYSSPPVSTFKTLKAVNAVSTPTNILVTAPSGITEAIVYSHARNGSETSSTISVLASSSNISLPTANYKEIATGNTFDFEGGEILISITNPEGDRSRVGIAGSANRATLGALQTNELIYASDSTFTVTATDTSTDDVDDVTDDVVDEDVDTEDTSGEVVTPPVVQPTPTTTPTTAVVTIPNTAIEMNDIVQYGQVVIAVVFVGVGLRLRYSKRK